MTDEQALTLARLMRDFNATKASVQVGAFELPEGYVRVDLSGPNSGGFIAGIAPNGDASS